MWIEICTEDEIKMFLKETQLMHDSCIKEMKYLSGGYVDYELNMHAVNDKRYLYLLIQRQNREFPTVELFFEGVNKLNLEPRNTEYDCVIYEMSLLKKEQLIYWSDFGGLNVDNIMQEQGTWIIAEKVYWRYVENGLGEKEVY